MPAKPTQPQRIVTDPYVKVWLMFRGKRLEKRKTPVVKNSLNPTFDEEFTFTTPMDRLRDVQLEITVMDYDAIGRNDTIGKVGRFKQVFLGFCFPYGFKLFFNQCSYLQIKLFCFAHPRITQTCTILFHTTCICFNLDHENKVLTSATKDRKLS